MNHTSQSRCSHGFFKDRCVSRVRSWQRLLVSTRTRPIPFWGSRPKPPTRRPGFYGKSGTIWVTKMPTVEHVFQIWFPNLRIIFTADFAIESAIGCLPLFDSYAIREAKKGTSGSFHQGFFGNVFPVKIGWERSDGEVHTTEACCFLYLWIEIGRIGESSII